MSKILIKCWMKSGNIIKDEINAIDGASDDDVRTAFTKMDSSLYNALKDNMNGSLACENITISLSNIEAYSLKIKSN